MVATRNAAADREGSGRESGAVTHIVGTLVDHGAQHLPAVRAMEISAVVIVVPADGEGGRRGGRIREILVTSLALKGEMIAVVPGLLMMMMVRMVTEARVMWMRRQRVMSRRPGVMMMMITTADGIQRIPRALALNSVNVRGDIARAGSSASTGLGATAVPDQILVTAELPRPHHDGSLVMMLMVDRRPDGPLLLRNFRVFGLKDEFFQVILELHAMLRTNTAVGVVGRVISLTRQRGCPGFVRHRRRRRRRRRDGTEGRRGGRNGGRHFSPGHGAPTLEGGAWGVFPWRDGGGQIIFAAGGRSRSRRGRGPNVFLGLSAPWRDGSHDA